MNYKKMHIITLALAFSMLISGCAFSDINLPYFPTKVHNEAVDEDSVEQTEPPEMQNELIIGGDGDRDEELPVKLTVSYSEYREIFNAPDDEAQAILKFSYTQPKIKLAGNESVSEIINEKIAISNELFYSGNNRYPGVSALFEAALDAYTFAAETDNFINSSFLCTRTAEVLRADDKIFSIMFTDSYNVGEFYEAYETEGMTFSVENGNEIHFSDLGPDIEAINACVVPQLPSDWNLTTGEDISTCFVGMNKNGLLFAFKSNICTIGYETLQELLYSDLLPKAQKRNASVEISDFDASKEYDTEISDIIVVNELGCEYLLTFSGAASNVRLTEVTYNYDRFYELREIWYSNLVEDSAVQIKMVVPEGMPNLKLSYDDGETVVSEFLISQSGFDGNPILVGTDIIAVG